MSRSTIKRILWKKSKKLKWFITTRNYRAEIKSLNLTIRIYTSYRARSENHHPLILLPFVFSRVKMYFSHFWFLPRTFWFTNISWKPEPNDSFKHHFHFQGPKMSKIQWHLAVDQCNTFMNNESAAWFKHWLLPSNKGKIHSFIPHISCFCMLLNSIVCFVLYPYIHLLFPLTSKLVAVDGYPSQSSS